MIGGSLGLGIRKKRLAHKVVGVFRHKSTAAQAKSRGAVSEAVFDLKKGIAGADLVVFATPVSSIVRDIKNIGPKLSGKTLVIDVGSSKLEIDRAARRYLKQARFVGCHPMAGSASLGVRNASAELFKGAQCFVTRKEAKVSALWKALGAQPIQVSAEVHDRWVARMSHVPHILSFALFSSKGMAPLSRYGLKAENPSIQDLARISKSGAELWADILHSNRKDIVFSLNEFETALRKLKKAIAGGRTKSLENIIRAANRASERLAPRA